MEIVLRVKNIIRNDIKKLFLDIFNVNYCWRIILLGMLAVFVIFYGLDEDEHRILATDG